MSVLLPDSLAVQISTCSMVVEHTAAVTSVIKTVPAAIKVCTPLGHLDLCGHSELALVLCDLDAVSKDTCSMSRPCMVTAAAMAKVWPGLAGLWPGQLLTLTLSPGLTGSIVDRTAPILCPLQAATPVAGGLAFATGHASICCTASLQDAHQPCLACLREHLPLGSARHHKQHRLPLPARLLSSMMLCTDQHSGPDVERQHLLCQDSLHAVAPCAIETWPRPQPQPQPDVDRRWWQGTLLPLLQCKPSARCPCSLIPGAAASGILHGPSPDRPW